MRKSLFASAPAALLLSTVSTAAMAQTTAQSEAVPAAPSDQTAVAAAPSAPVQIAAADQSVPAPVATVPAPQRAAATDQNNGDIIVTARKRSESVQNVPISITAIGPAALQAKAIVNFDSLSTSLSGVGITRSANNILTFYIRGLGTGPGADSFEQSVALFIDGSYAGRPAEYNQGLFDVERVEVIKGTQAALLAKNTSLGAVSIVTRKPGDHFAFNVAANYDATFGGRDLQGGVDVPVTDTLAVRFSGISSLQTGFGLNPLTGSKYMHTNALAGRMVAVWKPTANFNATLMYQAYDTKSIGTGEEYIADIFGNARARSLAEGYPDWETKLDYRSARSDSSFGDSTESTHGQRAVATLNYDLGRYTVTSVSAYSDYAQDRKNDNDNMPGDYISVPILNNGNNQFTQELRLTSPAEDRFNFVVGAFFLRENWHYNRSLIATRGHLPVGYKDITTIGGAPTAIVATGSFQERFGLQTTTYSGFGQANFDLTKWLTLNAGIRGTSEQREAHYFRNSQNLVGSLILTFSPLPDTREGFTATNVDGSAGAQIKLGRGKLLYASWSQGTKGGGYFNSPAKLTGNERYLPEVAQTIEAGTKLTFGGSYFNLALFKTDVSHYQQAVFTGIDFISPDQDLVAKGVEAEGQYQVFDGFKIGGTVTYLDAKRKDKITLVNNNTPPLNAPKWSGDINANYNTSLTNDLRLTIDSDVYFKSPVYYTTTSATIGGFGAPPTAVIPKGPSYALFNAHIGISSEKGGWNIGVVGKNLFDRRYIAYARAGSLIPGTALGTAGAPRTVALQFSLKR